ncbi:MAG: hypothetical protein ACFE75_09550 [Candidatus Hodarchaeota archaeon]
MEKKIFVLTEDMSFFFRLNKELTYRNISFKILNIRNKIPEFGALILTTCEEFDKYNLHNLKIDILAYDRKQIFENFIIKFLAAYKIGYKDQYSELTFSIDPGTKHIGLVVFLDDYFFISHTVYDNKVLLKKVKNYIEFFQNNDESLIKLNFKFGRGVLPVAYNLISQIFNIYKYRKNMRVFLIDELNSSKIKICDNSEKKIPKDEASALILALRDGIEVSKTNYKKIFNQIKSKKLSMNKFLKENFHINNELTLTLREIVQKVLKGKITLTESKDLITKMLKTPK